MQNGNPNLPESVDDLDVDLLQLDAEVSVPFLEPQSIVDGFERVVVQKEGEDGSLLLKLVAEILIKATMYPGSFESHKTKIEEAIKKLPPNQDTMCNLSEMIVHWVSPSMFYVCYVVSHPSIWVLTAVLEPCSAQLLPPSRLQTLKNILVCVCVCVCMCVCMCVCVRAVYVCVSYCGIHPTE